MQVRKLMLEQYKKEWEEITSRFSAENRNFYDEYGLDFENMQKAFTLDEVQVYVDNDIANSPQPAREDYHINMLTKLARLYANTVFLMLRTEVNRRSFFLDKEAFYDKAIDTLKNRYHNSTAYPCNRVNPKFMSTGGGDGGGVTLQDDNLVTTS